MPSFPALRPTRLDAGKEKWNEVRLAAAPSEAALGVAEKEHATAIGAKKKAWLRWRRTRQSLPSCQQMRPRRATKRSRIRNSPSWESAIAAKQKAVDTAEKAVATAVAEVGKLKPAADAERSKTLAATQALEAARSEYQQKKTAWKLAQRRLRDAEDLVAYHQKVRRSGSDPGGRG